MTAARPGCATRSTREFRAGTEQIGVFDTRDLGPRPDGTDWVSGMIVRPAAIDAATATPITVLGNTVGGAGEEVVGTIDAVSHAVAGWELGVASCGSGYGLAGISGNPEADADAGGETGLAYNNPHYYQCQRQVRSGTTAAALELNAKNLANVAIDVAGAGLPVGAFTLSVRGDGPLTVLLAGTTATAAIGSCLTSVVSSPAGLAVTVSATASPCSITVGG